MGVVRERADQGVFFRWVLLCFKMQMSRERLKPQEREGTIVSGGSAVLRPGRKNTSSCTTGHKRLNRGAGNSEKLREVLADGFHLL